jgi:hypothetical protein
MERVSRGKREGFRHGEQHGLKKNLPGWLKRKCRMSTAPLECPIRTIFSSESAGRRSMASAICAALWSAPDRPPTAMKSIRAPRRRRASAASSNGMPYSGKHSAKAPGTTRIFSLGSSGGSGPGGATGCGSSSRSQIRRSQSSSPERPRSASMHAIARNCTRPSDNAKVLG